MISRRLERAPGLGPLSAPLSVAVRALRLAPRLAAGLAPAAYLASAVKMFASLVDNKLRFALPLKRESSDPPQVNTRRGRADTLTRRQDHKAPRRRVSAPRRPPIPLITLLTDFGNSDYFVSAVKGVILTANPQTRIVDITHDIHPQDVEAAAFTLLAAYSSFPSGTIHVAVVDPGVGSSRRPLLIEAGCQFFVGPDNGIFSYVCEREPMARVFELTNKDYFRQPVSPTFHGRDIFAPVSAAIADGLKPEELGREIQNPVRLAPLLPKKV